MNSSLINKLKNISEKDKEILVQKVFSSVSKRYDFMNDLMSFGLHRVWKDYFTQQININNKSIVLDLASGSGDIIKNLKKKSSAKFVALDANLDMIKEAKKKINDEWNSLNIISENASTVGGYDLDLLSSNNGKNIVCLH